MPVAVHLSLLFACSGADSGWSAALSEVEVRCLVTNAPAQKCQIIAAAMNDAPSDADWPCTHRV